MVSINDMVGRRYGRLEVVEFYGSKKGQRRWLCRCDCGGTAVVQTSHLVSGNNRSCGCLHIEAAKKNIKPLLRRRLRHGHTQLGKTPSPTYQSWRKMIQRCTNPKTKYFGMYGGRGIKVCASWRVFENFLLDMGERPNGKTLDRIDTNGDYCKSNCAWKTPHEQNRNMRSNHWIEYNGERMILTDWARKLGKSDSFIGYWLSKGKSMQFIQERSQV